MKIQLIRNATLKMNYADMQILVDPMLCAARTFPPFVKGLEKNPTVDLPLAAEEIISQIDALLVTHSHPDHFDPTSAHMFPANLPVFCTPADRQFFSQFHFNQVQIVENEVETGDIKITRIEGQHGSGPVLQYMGEVSGYLLEAPGEPKIYIVGDSILIDSVQEAIQTHQPDIIITNSGEGILPGFEATPVLMGAHQTIAICKTAPSSKVIAVHLEAIDFCKTTRTGLREKALENGISDTQLYIPEDGEVLHF